MTDEDVTTVKTWGEIQAVGGNRVCCPRFVEALTYEMHL
jgi:hypothetical protein